MALDQRILLEIALDLSRSLVSADRNQRVVTAVRRAVPCDAAALLRVEGDDLVPLAAFGLAPETLGRSFARSAHPRLEIICGSETPVLFPADSKLPDPFDGLIVGHADALAHVHACLGCPLRVDGELVGVLTADALEPGAFSGLDAEDLSLLAALAGAALRTNLLIELTEGLARHQRSVASELMNEKLGRVGDMIGQSAALCRLRADIDLVAPTRLNVLISGETGVGKELVARAVHDGSPRRHFPLIHVNCAALPEALAESELFGHTRGAFTGADRERPGKFEIAKDGTLFLDEVGELPRSIQPKLLRALQTGEIQRVGSDRLLRFDTRIVAATNRDLASEVTAGRFRADLFHRLNGFPLHVPSLRERPEDIAALAGYFTDRSRGQLGIGSVRFTDEARIALETFDWPGNVRELENVLARIVLRASRGKPRGTSLTLTASDVQPELRPSFPPTAPAQAPSVGSPSLEESVNAYKRARILSALSEADGNWTRAAAALGVARTNLRVTARRLGIE